MKIISRDVLLRAVRRSWPWTAAGIVMLGTGFWLWWFPKWQLESWKAVINEPNWKAVIDQSKKMELKDLIKLESDLRTGWAQILGGAIFLVGLYLTWKTYRLNREGQITDRFSNAIDHLDYNRMLDVRLGGIYALERIARDSKKDHWQIMEVLTAYVREHAPRKKAALLNGGQPDVDRMQPSADIQAVLTILGRREQSFEREAKNRLDLRFTNLQEADLYLGHLEGVSFTGANLTGANLRRAYLTKADMRDADLRRATFPLAHLEGAVFTGAKLTGTVFMGADLSGATLVDADLRKANLREANLHEAHFPRADLRGADLEDANLEEASLQGANLQSIRNLVAGQVVKAKTLFDAKLDSELLKELQTKYPRLLQKPEPESQTKETPE